MGRLTILKPLASGLTLLVGCSLLSSHGGTPQEPWAKENVSFPLLNQEIRHQLEEHKRQTELQTEQGTLLTLETQNKADWETLQKTSGEIRSRLEHVSTLMQLVPFGYAVYQRAERLAKLEARLLEELEAAPYAIPQTLIAKLKWMQEFQLVVRYLIGLTASYGALNQMEAADRKVLLDFGLEELASLEAQSLFTLHLVQESRRKYEQKKALVFSYVARDRALVNSILNQLKTS